MTYCLEGFCNALANAIPNKTRTLKHSFPASLLQAEIKRLKEAEKLKAKDRAMMMKQADEISRMKHNTKQVKNRTRSHWRPTTQVNVSVN